MNGMPTVAIHDLVIHPRDNDLIAGTHGRGIFILDDITSLQQLTEAVRNAPAHLFRNRPATIWEDASRGGIRGHFFFAGENPPYIPKRDDVVRAKLTSGALINYYLKAAPQGDALLEIIDITGQKKRTLLLAKAPGIGRARWDLRFDPAPQQVEPFRSRMERAIERLSRLPGLSTEHKAAVAQAASDLKAARTADQWNSVRDRLADLIEEIGVSGIALGGPLAGEEAGPGDYLLRLTAEGRTFSGKLTVRPDPMWSGTK
jgi:hypothetical protein